jgi:hypothetical protein
LFPKIDLAAAAWWHNTPQRLCLAQQRGLGDDRSIDAMVQFDPLVQMEDVDPAVLKELSGFGEVRDNPQLGIDDDQARDQPSEGT